MTFFSTFLEKHERKLKGRRKLIIIGGISRNQQITKMKKSRENKMETPPLRNDNVDRENVESEVPDFSCLFY